MFFGLLFRQIPFDGKIMTFLRITYFLQAACVAVAALMQYFLMASFCWMLVEGIYIYLFVVKVYNVSDKMHRYHVFCWGEEQEMNKWDRTCRNTWGNISILICENQTEQKYLKTALFFNSSNEHTHFLETIGSSRVVPELIVKYSRCSLELVTNANSAGWSQAAMSNLWFFSNFIPTTKRFQELTTWKITLKIHVIA